ncbi:AIR synthase family protein [Isachenkonia alkalipeptolytica]|uniref:AIR synthase n=1 Tax=Isachenkonia alkalipeptolytica TaxID=2565777 RepID=A0AA43XIK3_9CLOT|nr:AIR synthase family protein [Isachenkonia alkalipeptolytica]NBG87458.1 AIR synthase [Isachenkonia alkalipeptolytica]
MKIGKIPAELLQELIFKNIKHKRKEVLMGSGVGEDCAVVDFGDYIGVLSTDPITGASSEIGSLAVHISCNDVASNGVEPVGLLLTILAPPDATEEELKRIMEDANRTACEVDVEIMGGHTEITDAVNKIVISTTAIGRQPKNGMTFSKGAQPGDRLIMTKHGGLEGAAIIAHDLEEKLTGNVSKEAILEAKTYSKEISVVKEGKIAGAFGVNSMHDVTEGGILGALWELGEASSLGVKVYLEDIPLRRATVEITEYLGIDPLKLISSGVMVMSVDPSKKEGLLREFSKNGVEAADVGEVIAGDSYLQKGDHREPLGPPDTDELYKVI